MIQYYLFGLNVSSRIPFDGLRPLELAVPGCPDVTVDLATTAEMDRRFSGGAERTMLLTAGQSGTVEVILGRSQDVQLVFGDRARFHVAADGSSVLCTPAEPDALDWQRVLLDTVLGTAALCAGHEGLHAAAVELPEGVVAIMASRDGGKSTLCAELLRRGALLFADDLVFLSQESFGMLAHPGPPLMNLRHDPAFDTSAFGQTLGLIDDEDWVAVPYATGSPQPLRLLVYLDRRDSVKVASMDPETSAAPLLANALDSGPAPDRRFARLALLGDLARETPMLRLVAPIAAPPDVLAGMLESAAKETRRT